MTTAQTRATSNAVAVDFGAAPRISLYIYVLVATLIAAGVLSVVVLYRSNQRIEETEHHANDYHLSAVAIAGQAEREAHVILTRLLEHELQIADGLTEPGEEQGRGIDLFSRELTTSLHLLGDAVAALTALQDRHREGAYQRSTERAANQLKAVRDSAAAAGLLLPTEGERRRTLRQDIDAFLVSLAQLKSLHQIAYDQQISFAAKLHRDEVEHFVTLLFVVLGAVALTMAFLLRQIRRGLARQSQAEETLAESERRLKTAAGMAKLGYFVWDLIEDRCLYCSDELARLHGLSVEDYMASATGVKTEAERFLHPDDRQRYLDAVERSYQTREPLNIEYRIVTAEGNVRQFHEVEHVFVVENDAPVRSEGTVQDITEIKLAEEQLLQAQKMEAVGQLTGGVAHDFNNLLTVILGNLQLMERSAEGDERLGKRVRTAKTAAQRGAELTKSLLAFARQQRLEAKVVDLNDTVCQMKRLLGTTLGETVELRFDLSPGLVRTEIDPAQLENALLNLAINARDAMPDGGCLTVKTANVEIDDAYAARRPEVNAGSYAMLSLADSGMGMSSEVRKRAFEPFFTTKDVGKGTGLGLSMVFGFIKQSGGHITLYSEEGHGSCFNLYLPAALGKQSAATPQPEDTVCPEGSETILVVEDQPEVRETSLAMLEELGYQVLAAENGPSALEVLRKHPEIDLLFTDIVMPEGMNGLELAKAACSVRPELKVLYTSGFSEKAAVNQPPEYRDLDWLAKPFFNLTLAQKVREVLDKS